MRDRRRRWRRWAPRGVRSWRLLAIDGFEVDVPDSKDNIAEFGYAGSGDNQSAFPKAPVVAVAECGTRPFVAAEIGSFATGEKTLAARLYPRPRPDELLTVDRNFYSWDAWDAASATGAALVWRAPTQLDLPVIAVLPDGTYLTTLVKPSVRGRRRARLLQAARTLTEQGADLSAPEAVFAAIPDAFDESGRPVVRLARVAEYDVPDRTSNGSEELIVLLSSIYDPSDALADELAAGQPALLPVSADFRTGGSSVANCIGCDIFAPAVSSGERLEATDSGIEWVGAGGGEAACGRWGIAAAVGGAGPRGDADRVREPAAGAEPGPHHGGEPGTHGESVRRARGCVRRGGGRRGWWMSGWVTCGRCET